MGTGAGYLDGGVDSRPGRHTVLVVRHREGKPRRAVLVDLLQ